MHTPTNIWWKRLIRSTILKRSTILHYLNFIELRYDKYSYHMVWAYYFQVLINWINFFSDEFIDLEEFEGIMKSLFSCNGKPYSIAKEKIEQIFSHFDSHKVFPWKEFLINFIFSHSLANLYLFKFQEK
jgi:hypothetical protein